ncbi:type II toxin-antitoxin system Phd/YefM family antitoxin [Oligoflexus tunisiensis]|uniref:type II toxin-antitoxin system Phd/YefM family antitoxin n=1 Tax=Oligoflexus tunisiensis TaxID=708132 RepID=UPI00114D0B50|nr:type II toxin-antitoxin system prevent-host-death family antitoxin [Oligoflexus tunisiensis]
MSDVIKKPLGEAKNEFSELVKLVECEGVEIVIMRHGKACARLIPVEKQEKPKLAGFMRDLVSYPAGADLELNDDAWGEIEADGEKIRK